MRRKCLLVLVMILATCGTSHGKNPVSTVSQLNSSEYTIGTDTDGAMLALAEARFPDARKGYYSDKTGGYAALLTGKADAFIENLYEADYDLRHGLEGVKILPGSLGEGVKISAGLSKTSAIPGLEEKFNSFIARAKSEGLIDGMIQHWVYGSAEMPDVDVPAKSDVRVVLGTTGLVVPFSFYAGNEITGFDVELARRFAASIGAELEVKVYDFGGLLMALATGEVDIALSNLYYSRENSGSLKFSDVLYTVEPVALVREDMYSPSDTANSGNFSAFSGKRIGVFTGSVQYDMVRKKIPGAEISYFDAIANVIASLTSGKIDAAAVDETIAAEFERENPGLSHLPESLGDTQTAFFFPKSKRNNPLLDEVNDYLRRKKSDGTLDELRAVWSGTDESRKVIPDYSSFPATKGTVSIAVDNETPVFSYMKDGKLAGYDIDVIVRFCKERGYRPDFSVINFPGLIAAISSGKCDMGAGGITITPERAESVKFSEPLYTVSSYLVVKKPASQQPPARTPKYSRTSELDGKPIGMQPGIIDWEEWAAEYLPHSQVQYYSTYPDLASALKTHKIEGFLVDSPVLELMAAEDDQLTAIDETIGKPFGYSFVYAKTERGRKLCDEMSEYLRGIKASGELDAVLSKWQGKNESAKIPPDYKSLPAKNGTLTFALEGGYPPFNYYKDAKLAGIDLELAVMFCGAYGYGLNVQSMTWDAMMPAVYSGKIDFTGDFTPSEEHEEAVYFSEPYCMARSVMACLKADTLPTVSTTSRRNLDSFNGKTIAIQTGTASETLVPAKLPSAKLAHYDSLTNQLTALKSGKADALATSLPPAVIMTNEDSTLEIINPPLRETYFYQMFADTEKGRKLCAEYSAFLKTLWDDGTIDALNHKWLGADESRKVVDDYSALPGTNGTMRMAVDASFPPFVYVKDNKIVGYDVDTAAMFCKARGYSLVVENMTLSGAISSVKTGKSDFSQSMNKTPEREENTLFTSTPTIKAGNVLVAQKSQESDTEGISSMKVSDFGGKKVGLMIGSDSAKKIEDKIPGVNILFFDSPSHILPSLRSGRIDAFYCALPTARNIIHTYDDLAYIPEYVNTTRHTAMFPKTERGRELCGEYADFLKTLSADGTLDSLTEKWITGTDESRQATEDYSHLQATNGTLTMAVTEGLMPFVFVKDNRVQGYDIDLAVLFCKHKGCGLNIEVMNHNGVLSSLQTGKCDFTYSVQWTEERDKTVLFSPVPNAVTGSVLVVMRDEDTRSVRMDLAAFSGKRIGVPTATSNAEIVGEVLPDAKLVYFDSPSEMLLALRQGKIDALSCSLPTTLFMMDENHDMQYLSEPLKKSYHSATFTPSEKGRKLCEDYSAFLKGLWDNGTIDKLFSKWFKEGEEARHTEDYSSLPAVKGTLRMAVDTGMIPFVYVKDGRIQGYDIDLAVMFCEAEGWRLELVPISRLGALEAVKSGKCDFSYAMAQTEERAKSVIFASVPNSENDNMLVIMKPA
ncbi:MAG: transporter substrate-binding domain-containing protein, partial [Synergistaceae bacterium]|nr:transporter substrate-binding domain-containing protein [Synergistaceae bacterium]